MANRKGSSQSLPGCAVCLLPVKGVRSQCRVTKGLLDSIEAYLGGHLREHHCLAGPLAQLIDDLT